VKSVFCRLPVALVLLIGAGCGAHHGKPKPVTKTPTITPSATITMSPTGTITPTTTLTPTLTLTPTGSVTPTPSLTPTPTPTPSPFASAYGTMNAFGSVMFSEDTSGALSFMSPSLAQSETDKTTYAMVGFTTDPHWTHYTYDILSQVTNPTAGSTASATLTFTLPGGKSKTSSVILDFANGQWVVDALSAAT
jgi:hypothetical protein